MITLSCFEPIIRGLKIKNFWNGPKGSKNVFFFALKNDFFDGKIHTQNHPKNTFKKICPKLDFEDSILHSFYIVKTLRLSISQYIADGYSQPWI